MLLAEKKCVDHAIGMSRGGGTTKVHMLADGHGNPIHFEITGGQVHDSQMASPLIALSRGESIIADKGYDSTLIREWIEKRGAIPIIPQRRRSIKPNPHYDSFLYKSRYVIENLFAKIKHFRSVATRYDKLARNYQATVCLAGIVVWARL